MVREVMLDRTWSKNTLAYSGTPIREPCHFLVHPSLAADIEVVHHLPEHGLRVDADGPRDEWPAMANAPGPRLRGHGSSAEQHSDHEHAGRRKQRQPPKDERGPRHPIENAPSQDHEKPGGREGDGDAE
jgi:hypothetical protein